MHRLRFRPGREAALLLVAILLASPMFGCVPTYAAVKVRGAPTSVPTPTGGAEGGALESAAAKAGEIGRAVAMSLIGLALAVAATVLAFKRDFKEAAGVFAVGIVAVLLATPTGVSVLHDTVSSLFGSP